MLTVTLRNPRLAPEADLHVNVDRKILLTGATGYVGGRLLPLLQAARYPVRCFTRREIPLQPADNLTEYLLGDMLDYQSLEGAMQGIDTAFYFVHSMGSKTDFENEDRQAATNYSSC